MLHRIAQLVEFNVYFCPHICYKFGGVAQWESICPASRGLLVRVQSLPLHGGKVLLGRRNAGSVEIAGSTPATSTNQVEE